MNKMISIIHDMDGTLGLMFALAFKQTGPKVVIQTDLESPRRPGTPPRVIGQSSLPDTAGGSFSEVSIGLQSIDASLEVSSALQPIGSNRENIWQEMQHARHQKFNRFVSSFDRKSRSASASSQQLSNEIIHL